MTRILLSAFVAAAALGQTPDATASLDLEILDERGGRAAARAQLLDASGKPQAFPETGLTAAHPRFANLGVIVRGHATLPLPSGRWQVAVDRGLEYRRITLPVEAAAGVRLKRQARLTRWIDLAGRGWWSGDTHVHRLPAEMPELMLAADLHFAPTLTRWNDRSSLDSWPENPVFTVERNRVYTVNNAEDERPWGAAMFLGLRRPIPLYRFQDEHPPPLETWRAARAEGAFIDFEKVIWWAAPVIAALEKPDSIGVANNHFREASVMDNEAWGRPRNSLAYPGPEGFARYIFHLYALFQNAGFRVAASAGSANGVLASPLGYNRSYVYLGRTFSPEAWLAGQKAGRNFVTNGPVLFLTVDGRMPGEVLPANAADSLIQVEALTAGRLGRVEILVDGAPVNTFVPMVSGESQRMVKRARRRLKAGSWVAARALESIEDNARFAFTSPVYVGDTPKRSPAALALMREWIDEYMSRIEKLPDAQLTPGQRAEWLEMCKQARSHYE